MEDQMDEVYCRGDLVFAKVRGYPPWPARVSNLLGINYEAENSSGCPSSSYFQVEGLASKSSKEVKYSVLFFGTFERGRCTESNLYHYQLHKEKYGRSRRRGFEESLQQIEEAARDVSGASTSEENLCKARESTPNKMMKTEEYSEISTEDSLQSEQGSRPELLTSEISMNQPSYVVKEEPIESEETWRNTIKDELTDSDEMDYHFVNVQAEATEKKDLPDVSEEIIKTCSLENREHDHHPIHINAGVVNALLDNDLENPDPSSEADTVRELSNTSSHPEEQELVCPVCGKASQSTLLHVKHKKLSKKERSFKCDTCNKHYPMRMSFKGHTALHTLCKKVPSRKSVLPGKGDQDVLQSGIDSVMGEDNSERFTLIQEIQKKNLKNRKCKSDGSMRIGSEEIYSPETKKQTRKHCKGFLCNICNKVFTTKSFMKVHLHKHTGEKPFACKVCCKQFKQSNHLKQHQIVHSGEKPFECRECGKRFAQSSHLNSHLGSHMGAKLYKCDVCSKGFAHNKTLNVHMLIHNDVKPFICSICGRGFRQKTHLKGHIRIHTGDKPYKCNECGKEFISSQSLTSHSPIHSIEKPFICSICGRGFRQKTHLKGHIRTHTGDKPFKCKECGKEFTRSEVLKVHSRIHLNEYPFVCSICGKAFRTKAGLKYHNHIHTGEKPYKCNVCGKEFISSQSLTSHSLIHSIEKPFICSICGKGFRQQTNLKRHIRIHTGDKPYKCNECGKEFISSQSLTSHSPIHSIEKPFVCSFCGRGFKHKCTLGVHILIHTRERPFLCDSCKMSFKTKWHLTRHIKSKHI